MIERTFLLPPGSDGTRQRAKIIEMVNGMRDKAHADPEFVKFKCRVNDKYDEIVAYNDIVDFIEADHTWDGVWKFREIKDHENVTPGHERYKGSSINVLIEWENGR
jgi:hypothetical protein